MTPLISVYILCLVIVTIAKMDPYTGEEVSDDYEYSYEEYDGYEYYSDDENQETSNIQQFPPGYLPPLKPTIVTINAAMLSRKFIVQAGELFGCLPQNEMTTSNVIDPKKKGGPTNAEEETPAPEESVKDPNKKLNFRELQEEKVKLAREKMKLDAIILRHRLGSSCERMICGACRVIVEEFSNRVVNYIDNSTIRYIQDLATFDFCYSREITSKYRPVVNHVCTESMINVTAYRNALVLPFEEISNWHEANSLAQVAINKERICLQIGACDKEHFEIQLTPANKFQEHWDDRCYVCQAFARDLEERIGLTMQVTESTAVSITAQTCHRLNLNGELNIICKELVSGKLLDDIAWLAKIHGERVERKAISTTLFADSMCEEIKFCTKYIDPEQAQIQEEVVPVFF